ncbi:MAG TPA: alpha-amylase, partial [Marinilabiliales bacterium]|nr:alpha-amylase [Marinilabiliales bacterium]
TASHDAPRTATSLYNKNKYKFRAKPYDDANYRIEKPDGETRWIQKMLLIHQYTFVGAPHIWYGDEVGMWGADDPDTRKPMVWGDITYEPETSYPQGKLRKPDVVETDTQLFQFIKELIQLRKQHPALVHGTLEFLVTEDKNGTLLYKRTYNGDVIWVAFNISKNQQTITLEGIEDGLHSFYSVAPTSQKVLGEKLDVTLRPQSGGVFFYQ